jgi:branched-chain amino acid transport system ATP-binding protein
LSAVPTDGSARVSAPVLSARDITVSFDGITALEAVSTEVRTGEVLGVIGPNGAGKTTLFNVICGFVAPDSGSISFKGQELRKIRPDGLAAMGIARTLQGVGLFPKMTVLENVMVGANRFRRTHLASALLGWYSSDRDERALRKRSLDWLERLDCADVVDQLPTDLPFPLQKRVALARALVAQPELLLLDEPAGGLGAEDMRSLAELIRELRGSCAVMLVEHHMDLVMSVCDRICVLDFGRLICAGSPDEVRRNEKVLEAYLGREAEPENSVATGAVDVGG